jgi:hypothetical protein
MTRVYKSWSDGLALGLVQRNNGRPFGHRTTSPCNVGFLRLHHGLGIGCRLLYPCGSDAVGRWLVMVAPAQTWNPLRPSDPFSATIRQSTRLAHSFRAHLAVSMAPALLRALVATACTPSHPGFPFVYLLMSLTIAPLRLSNVGYS